MESPGKYQLLGRVAQMIEPLRRYAVQPWFSATTAVIGALAGFFAAIYSDEIKHAFPVPPGHGWPWYPGPFVWEAALGWTLLALFGFLFGFNSWALTKNTDDQLRRLEFLFQTLMPEELVAGFQKQLQLCYPAAAKGTTPAATPTEARDGILAVLTSLAYMMQLVLSERNSRDGEYCANIMIYRKFDGIAPKVKEDLIRRAKFSDTSNGDGRTWSGVLELEPTLAVFLKGNDVGPQSERLPRFVLEIPLPENRKDHGKSAVLPGAPEAFCLKEYTCVPDTYDMGDECRENRAFRPGVADEMDTYFRATGNDVRGFISIPVFRPGILGESPEDEPIAVVNLHRDAPIPVQPTGFDLFISFTTTHMFLLSELLESYLKSTARTSI
jgi:hypothetical protein